MSFRDKISTTGNNSWKIDLATHLGSAIENETCGPELRLTGRREVAERRYTELWSRRREPTAGYNCFGHVFACRRTTLYDADIEQILWEDGFGNIGDESQFLVGDVVVYWDERGPVHVAEIVRFDGVILTGEAHGPDRVPYVLSKFDDVSGEYEHSIDDNKWAITPVTRKVYRARAQKPKPRPSSWRGKILCL